LPKK